MLIKIDTTNREHLKALNIIVRDKRSFLSLSLDYDTIVKLLQNDIYLIRFLDSTDKESVKLILRTLDQWKTIRDGTKLIEVYDWIVASVGVSYDDKKAILSHKCWNPGVIYSLFLYNTSSHRDLVLECADLATNRLIDSTIKRRILTKQFKNLLVDVPVKSRHEYSVLSPIAVNSFILSDQIIDIFRKRYHKSSDLHDWLVYMLSISKHYNTVPPTWYKNLKMLFPDAVSSASLLKI